MKSLYSLESYTLGQMSYYLHIYKRIREKNRKTLLFQWAYYEKI